MAPSGIMDRATARCSVAPSGLTCRPRASELRSINSSFWRRSSSLSAGHCQRRRPLYSRNERGLQTVAMAGKVTGKLTLELEAGKANPAPPVGPALGARGVNIMEFCKRYNAETADKAGQIIPVEITVYEDRTFTFVTRSPPASFLLKEAAGIQKGAANPSRENVGQITRKQLQAIAETKLPDLNTRKIEAAMRTVEGTAKSLGISIID